MRTGTAARAARSAARAPIERSSLAQQVVERLRQQIYDRTLAPGSRLDEVELATELGVSRTPVREALRQLAARGLVELRAGRGAFVTQLTLEDQRDIFPIMARLEGWVAHQVAERASDADLERLTELHERLERWAAAGDVDRYWESNYVFHIALQELVGNRWLQDILGELRRKLNLARHRSLKLEGRMDHSLAEHRALLRALRRHKADEADALMQRHLLNQLDALLQLEGEAPRSPRIQKPGRRRGAAPESSGE
jgi:DNA-binding GntR family transcriptional regulator